MIDGIDPTTNGNITVNSLMRFDPANSPQAIPDYGSAVTDAVVIKIQARADCCVDESSNIDVFFSNNYQNIGAATKLTTNPLTFTYPGEIQFVSVPAGSSFQYVHVQKSGSGVSMSLQAVEVLSNGAAWIACLPAGLHAWKPAVGAWVLAY